MNKLNKIVIINPPAEIKVIREGRCEQRADSYQYLMVPISLPSIAAVLRERGFEVKILDCIADNISMEMLRNILKKEKILFAIINVATMSFNKDKKTAELCKKLGIQCAAIGMHVTTIPEDALKNSEFDFAIRGEPELISLNLAKAIKNKKDLKKVRGISFRKNGRIINNPDEKLIENLDKLPFPARDLLHNEKYIEPLTHLPYTLVITGRGCPFNCIFCTASRYYGKKQRIRSPKNIADEIEEVIRNFNITHIGMWNDTFTFNKEQVKGICKEIISRRLKIEWFCNSRVDTIDEEMIKLMAKSGCTAITFGVESLDEGILKNIKKGIKIEQVKTAIELCRKYRIRSQLHIIFGLPGETKDTIKKTIKKSIELDPDYAQFYCAVPFPGTEFREYALEKGYLQDVPWEKYEINNALVSYPHLSNKDIQKASRKAYQKFYLRPSYVLKKMKEFPLRDWKKISIQAFNFFRGWVFGD